MSEVLNGKLVVRKLRDFGLSEYEARVYFVLLTLGESRVGHISRRAYVPQSKMYEVLDKLIEKGLAEETSEERPKTFHAVALDRVMARTRTKALRS